MLHLTFVKSTILLTTYRHTLQSAYCLLFTLYFVTILIFDADLGVGTIKNTTLYYFPQLLIFIGQLFLKYIFHHVISHNAIHSQKTTGVCKNCIMPAMRTKPFSYIVF